MIPLRPLRLALLLCLVGLPIGAFWLGERLLGARNAARELVSQGRFDQLELALHIYHGEHGAFPPTKSQREAGSPFHSWRVLLLLHTSPEFKERYSHYNFSKQWNDPVNLQALGRRAPRFFRMDGEGDFTHYLAISDDEDWPSKQPLRSRLVRAGNDRFLLVEYPESQIHWMEPKY